ncbi:phBC6A51 family helix-turn-helix protein [Brevibacillus halotolerans]|nr:phBC6A51 family helix-turn-helix protein [Brevibacillus halotolerans]
MAFKSLNTEHYIAIGYLSQPKRSGKTMEEIAKECGVDRTTLYNWRKDPLFERELKRAIIRESIDRLPEVIESMADAAIDDKNAAAAKLVLQVNEMLTDRVEVEQRGSTDVPDIEELKRMVAEMDGE